MFDGHGTTAAKLRVLVDELFAFWGRAEPWLNVARCEESQVPALAAHLRVQDQAVGALIRSVLGGAADEEAARLVGAMTDFYTWKALKAAGLGDEAATVVTHMLLNHLGIERNPAEPEGGRTDV
jgi:hypothetical protein